MTEVYEAVATPREEMVGRCNCWTSPENAEGPQRACPEHGEDADWNEYPEWAHALFEQRDAAIEERDALVRRLADVVVENQNLARQCARLRMQLAEVRAR